MKSYLRQADRKTSSTKMQYHLFIGRWQPLHDGHKWLFEQVLNEGKNVLIGIRNVEPDENNPYTAIEVFRNIQDTYINEFNEGRLKIMILPDIEAVCFGRGVGYDVIEFVPPQEIHDISATKIRNQMK
jgi:cytidyltransferase-like protein